GREHPIISAAFWVVTSVAMGIKDIIFPCPIAFNMSLSNFKALIGTTILSFVSSISISALSDDKFSNTDANVLYDFEAVIRSGFDGLFSNISINKLLPKAKINEIIETKSVFCDFFTLLLTKINIGSDQ